MLLILTTSQLACQMMRSSSEAALRCPAGALACEALLTSGPVQQRVTLSYPPPDSFPLSPLTKNVVKNLELLGIPFELQKYPQTDAGPIAIELTFTQFVEAYQALPGGGELVSILNSQHVSSETLKDEINQWIKRFIPGYEVEWNYEGDSTFIEQGDFFDYLNTKRIPMANHHDLLVHLFLFCDPNIRQLTERLAKVYEKAVAYSLNFSVDHPSFKLNDRINQLWVRLQENTPVQYFDEYGQKRVAILGGFPSVVDPLQPYRGYFLDWIYFADIDSIYESIWFEIENKKNFPRRQETRELYLKTLTDIKKITTLPLSDTEQLLDRINHEFNLVSLTTPLYQERWKEFSKRVFTVGSDPSLSILRPQTHRDLMNKTLLLFEMILSNEAS